MFDKAYVVCRDITPIKELTKELKQVSTRRKEIAVELIEGREKSKEELYNELHDGINQLLFAASLNIQNSGIKDKNLESSQNKLKIAIEHIRKIALESTTQFVFNDYFDSTLTDYILGFNTNSSIRFQIDSHVLEPITISDNSKKHIFRIIQKLVRFYIDTTKAKQAVFRFKQDKNEFIIIASDNGFLNCKTHLESPELKLIQDRIYLIDGKIRFFNFTNLGMIVHIKIKMNE